MIVSSFQTQYGIRLSSDLKTMSWREFSYLLEGLSANTPLGQIVSVRAEKDPAILKEFTPEQRRIRNEYLSKQAKHKTPKETERALESIKSALIKMASG